MEVIESTDPVLAPVDNVPSSPEIIDVDDVPTALPVAIEVPVVADNADETIPAVENAEPAATVTSENKPIVDESAVATDSTVNVENAEGNTIDVGETADNDTLAAGTAAATDSVTNEEPTGDKTEVTTFDIIPAESKTVADIDNNDIVNPADVSEQVEPAETANNELENTVIEEPVAAELSADVAISDNEPISAADENNDVSVEHPVESEPSSDAVVDEPVANEVVAAEEQTPKEVVDQPLPNETEAVVSEVSENQDAPAEAADSTATEVVADPTIQVDDPPAVEEQVDTEAPMVTDSANNEPVAIDVAPTSDVPATPVEVEKTDQVEPVDETPVSEEVEQVAQVEPVEGAPVSDEVEQEQQVEPIEDGPASDEVGQVEQVEPVVDAPVNEDAEQTTLPDVQPENEVTNETQVEPAAEDPVPAAVEVLDDLVVPSDEPTPVVADPVEVVPEPITVDPVEPSSEPVAEPTEEQTEPAEATPVSEEVEQAEPAVTSEVAADTPTEKTPSPEPIVDLEEVVPEVANEDTSPPKSPSPQPTSDQAEVVPEVVTEDTPPAKSPSPIPPATPSPTPAEVKPVSPKPVSPVPSPAPAVTTPTPAAPKSTKTEDRNWSFSCSFL